MEAEVSRQPTREVDESAGIPVGEVGPTPLELTPGKVLPQLSRCPYCREDVRAGAASWVACEDCLARHHTSCWDEHGACASCRCRVSLERRGRRVGMVPLVVFGLLGVAGLVAVGVRVSIERVESQLKAQYDSHNMLVDLPVAAHELHEGDIVTESDIETRKYPRAGLEGLGRYMDDSKVIEGSKVVVSEIKPGEIFRLADFRLVVDLRRSVGSHPIPRPTASELLDRDIDIAKARGVLKEARRVVSSYEPDDTLTHNNRGDLVSATEDLVAAARTLSNDGRPDEAAKAKRVAEALYANEALGEVLKLLDMPDDARRALAESRGKPDSPPKESK